MRSVEEYHRLITENHNLIYGFLKRYDLDLDEYYDVAAIGLCKAAQSYDEEKGCAFSTLAYKCMKNEWGKLVRKRTQQNPDNLPTFPLTRYEDNESEDRLPELGVEADFAEHVDTMLDTERVLRTLNERDTRVVRELLAGKSTHEVAKGLGCSHQYVSACLKRIRRQYAAVTERDGRDEREKRAQERRKRHAQERGNGTRIQARGSKDTGASRSPKEIGGAQCAKSI